MARRWLALCMTAMLATSAAEVRAQDAQASAAAEALFEQARKLMDAGKYRDACPKFAESQRLDPGIGTMLYLADCYEKNGQTASAWATFREAADAAKTAGQADREQKARARAATLEPKLAKLTIVAPANVAGLEVLRDGLPVGEPLWGAPVPVNPGAHTIAAKAPGKKAFAGKVDVPNEPGASVSTTIPALEDAPASSGTPADKPGGDVAPVVPSTGTGAGSRTEPQDPGARHRRCGRRGPRARRRLRSRGQVQERRCAQAPELPRRQALLRVGRGAHERRPVGRDNLDGIAFIAGGVVLGAGAVVFLTAPSAPKAATTGMRVAPAFAPGVAGLAASGRFLG